MNAFTLWVPKIERYNLQNTWYRIYTDKGEFVGEQRVMEDISVMLISWAHFASGWSRWYSVNEIN